MTQDKCPLSDISPDLLDKYITRDQCDEKHETTKWVFGVLVALTAVFLGLVGFGATIAYQASSTAQEAVIAVQDAFTETEEVRTELRVYSAAQNERDKTVVKTLEQIRDEIASLRQEQITLMKTMLANKGDIDNTISK